MSKEPKYKVGDKVRVRWDLAAETYEGGLRVSIDMVKYIGRVATVYSVHRFDRYLLDIDNELWEWSDAMLEPLSHKELVDDILEQMYAELDEYKDKLHKVLYSDFDNISQNKEPEKKYYYHLIGGNAVEYINYQFHAAPDKAWLLGSTRGYGCHFQAAFTDEEIKKCPYVLAGFEKIEIK
mgnify:CR=1 FL=1